MCNRHHERTLRSTSSLPFQGPGASVRPTGWGRGGWRYTSNKKPQDLANLQEKMQSLRQFVKFSLFLALLCYSVEFLFLYYNFFLIEFSGNSSVGFKLEKRIHFFQIFSVSYFLIWLLFPMFEAYNWIPVQIAYWTL